MPRTVSQLLAVAQLTSAEVVPWGTAPTVDAPGVYLVSMSSDPEFAGGASVCPLSDEAVSELLTVRPELTVDGVHPSAKALAQRVRSMWLPGEPVVYIGRAGTSLRQRTAAYFRTPLGARAPHAGGWPLKTLSIVNQLFVHVAACDDPTAAEAVMIDAFVDSIPRGTSQTTCDPDLPLPFANLEDGRHRRKRHGIAGARAPRVASGNADDTRTTRTTPTHPTERAIAIHDGSFVLRVTEKDIGAGQVRVTRPAKRGLALPTSPTEVRVRLDGTDLTCRWDPRLGPDQERSGLLRVGRELMGRAFTGSVELNVRVDHAGTVVLDRV